ncbi:metal-dependent hydrolase [Sulfoacidibacillus ferrooxidans]|uniref:Metal-dependent hydrolase n=1 Tax=Sulfoacidibacillus ferrooxidans TaxID=2005001 RepID=A0A9X1VBM7_9BACL|nr:metal-dependent hydrolase [Sulfoacidibacillus ferrooxidans]MCI0184757.1 hypothetical protein [Sulfoacidibacillus ferrooxidans]
MLGRTHMAIGAIGATVITPLLIRFPWEPISAMRTVNLVPEALVVVGAVLGSLVPDLDESHSLLARKAEMVGRIAFLLIALYVLFVGHVPLTPFSLVGYALLAFTLFSRANLMRKIALGAVGLFAIYGVVTHVMPWVAGLAFFAWSMGAAFTSHRTFTHSVLGIGLFSLGMMMSLHGLWAVCAEAAMAGYALHLIADGIAGGVPLLWPLPARQGIRLVKTGSAADHAIGLVAVAGFLLLAVK